MFLFTEKHTNPGIMERAITRLGTLSCILSFYLVFEARYGCRRFRVLSGMRNSVILLSSYVIVLQAIIGKSLFWEQKVFLLLFPLLDTLALLTDRQ